MTNEYYIELMNERRIYREALKFIADHKIPWLNPDGEDQAAEEMQLVAREALGRK